MPLTIEEVRVVVTEQNTDAYDRLDASQRGLGKSTKAADVALSGFRGTLHSVSQASQLARNAFAAARVALDTLAQPVGLAISFEKEFAKIRTLVPSLGRDFQSELLKVASAVPQTAGDVARAAFDAISAGVSESDIPAFLRAASEFAVAGDISLQQSVGTLQGAVKAFKRDGVDAAQVGEVLFATMRGGITTVEELSAAFGTQAVSTYGVKIEELGAAVATLTQTGVDTNRAFTQVNALVRVLAENTGPTAKALKTLGVQGGVTALQTKGLVGVLAEIEKETGGAAKELAKLTNNAEAAGALMKLAGGAGVDLRESLDSVESSTGAVSTAAAIMKDITQGTIDSFKSLADVMLIQIGEQALPVVTSGVDRLTSLIETRGPEAAGSFATVLETVISLTVAMASAVTTAAEFFDLVSGERGRRFSSATAASVRGSAIGGFVAEGQESIDKRRAKQTAARDAAFSEASRLSREAAAQPVTQAGAFAKLELQDRAKEAGEVAQFATLQLRLLDKAEEVLKNQQGIADIANLIQGVDPSSLIPDAVLDYADKSAANEAKIKAMAAAALTPKPPKPPKPPKDGIEQLLSLAALGQRKLTELDLSFAESSHAAMQTRAAQQLALQSSLEDRSIALIADDGERRLAAMTLRHEREFQLAVDNGLKTEELLRLQGEERARQDEEFEQRRQHAAFKTASAYADSAAASINAIKDVVSVIGEAAGGGDALKSALLGFDVVFHSAKAAGQTALAASSFALGPIGIPQGIAHTAAAVSHTAAAVQSGLAAGKVGRGGKGNARSSGGARGAGGVPSTPRDRLDDPGRNTGTGGGVTNLTLVLSDLVLPPDPASLERAVPALAEAFERANLTRGFGGLPGASAFADD